MDSKTPREVSKELAREQLIAISYSLPDNVPDLKVRPDITDNATTTSVVNGGDSTEKYRSELISISYSQPADAKVLPVAINHEG